MRRLRVRVVVPWVALALALCALAAEGPRFTKGEVLEWNGGLIDQITFVQEGPWGGWYDALEVAPLDSSKATSEGNEKGLEAAKTVAAKQDGICREALADGYTAAKPRLVPKGEAPPAEARVALLEWRCTEINPGSRAKRFWLSFGAGQSGVTLAGSLKDKATGQELLRFTHRRSSGFNIVTGGDYERLLTIDSGDAARDVGAMVGLALRKPGKPAPAPAAPETPAAPVAAEPTPAPTPETPAAVAPPAPAEAPPAETPPPSPPPTPPAEPQSPAGG